MTRNNYLTRFILLCALYVLAWDVPCASALVMGNIQVSSALGETLKARIDLDDLTVSDALALNVQLASVDKYKSSDLQYPEGVSFTFEVVHKQGKKPFVQITTSQQIFDPFVNLLIEISSSSRTFSKQYVFFLNPTIGASNPTKSSPPLKNQHNNPLGELALSLSMSSFLAKNDLNEPKKIKSDSIASNENRIELNELNELNAKINETQAKIKNIRSKLGAISSVASSTSIAPLKVTESEVPLDLPESDKVTSTSVTVMPSVAKNGPVTWTELFKRNLKKTAVYWLLLLLAVTGISWFLNSDKNPKHNMKSKNSKPTAKRDGKSALANGGRMNFPKGGSLRI